MNAAQSVSKLKVAALLVLLLAVFGLVGNVDYAEAVATQAQAGGAK